MSFLGPDLGPDPGPGPLWTRCFRPTPALTPVTWTEYNPGQEKKNAKQEKISNREEPDGTSIESFHYYFNKLSQRVEVLTKPGFLSSSLNGNIF